MSNKLKKSIAMISAVTLVTTTVASMNVLAVDTTEDTDNLEYTQFPFIKECEDPEIANGNETWTSIYEKQLPNYSGDGFVYLTGNSIKFEITVPEDAMYEIKVRYAQILSADGRMQTICVNGSDYMVNFPYTDTWQDISFGMFRLKAGVNTIEIKPQYGYASYDTITVDKAVFPDLNVEPTLVDKNATPETQSLMNYLCDVYGNGILSGQQEIYGGGNDGDYELEFDFIENLTGELPAIRGFDFMNYNPLYGWDDNTTERVIEWVNDRNGIATGCWHINVPKDFSNYELGDTVDWKECTYKPDETDFDTNNAIVEGTKEYEYFMLAIEDLAEQLLRLQEANVPIILRPLHEAEGNSNTDGSGSWFWWGKGGAETYKELWKLLYTTLTEEYGLHNIIWEYNSYDYTTSAQWYPGDDYVDIVGFDKYNTVYNRHDGLTSGPNVDAISSTFYSLVNLTDAKKLVSMPENDTIPTIENMEVEEARWLYFCPWYGEHILDSSKNDPETVKAIYQDDYCINLTDLPENLYSYKSEQGELAETVVIQAPIKSLEGNTLTLNFHDDLINGTKSYTISDEEVAKYPTDITELINTNVVVTFQLIEGTEEYDIENPKYIDIVQKKYGTIIAKDDTTFTISLDNDKGEITSPIYSYNTHYDVGDYLIIGMNDRTNETLWIDLISSGKPEDITTTTEITTTPIETTTTSKSQIVNTYLYGVVTEMTDDAITIVDSENNTYVCPISSLTSVSGSIKVGSNVMVYASIKDNKEVYYTMSISRYTGEITTTTTPTEPEVTTGIALIGGTITAIDGDIITVKFENLLDNENPYVATFDTTASYFHSDLETISIGDNIKALGYYAKLSEENFDFDSWAKNVYYVLANNDENLHMLMYTGTITEVTDSTITVKFGNNEDDTTYIFDINGDYFYNKYNAQVGDSINAVSIGTNPSIEDIVYMEVVYSNTHTQTTTTEIPKGDSDKDVLLGDVNGDDNVMGNDLLLLKKYALGLAEISDINFNNSDVNKDGEVNGLDLLMLKKYNLGLVELG